MCDCIKAAIENDYVIRGGTYDEDKHEFIDLDVYWIPVAVRGRKGHLKKVNIGINHCPWCGISLTQ